MYSPATGRGTIFFLFEVIRIMNRWKVVLFVMSALFVFPVIPASADGEKSREDDLGLDWFGMIQLWGVYSSDVEDGNGDTVHSRGDLYVRRGRFGVKGSIREDVAYKICLAYDNLGKNDSTASSGTPQANASDNREFYIWDTIFTWKVDPTWLNITAGYFRPQVGRESITTAFKVNSFIKSLANGFVRRHIVGRGPGRETGVNVGGLYHDSDWGFNYNVGVFDTNHANIQGVNTPGGTKWSPLVAGRFAFTLGDPEMNAYSIGYGTNYYGRRRGATLALNVTQQQETEMFRKNNMIGVDMLTNYDNLNVSGEVDWLKRNVGAFSYTDTVYHGRVGWNIPLDNGQHVEPAVMYSRFHGATDSINSAQSQSATDVGVNWYIDKHKCKVNLHYTWQDDNNMQDLGNFLGLGVQFVF